jgi:hypothetical protein
LGKNGSVVDGSVRNGLVAKKVAADLPPFNWFHIFFRISHKKLHRIAPLANSFFSIIQFLEGVKKIAAAAAAEKQEN